MKMNTRKLIADINIVALISMKFTYSEIFIKSLSFYETQRVQPPIVQDLVIRVTAMR